MADPSRRALVLATGILIAGVTTLLVSFSGVLRSSNDYTLGNAVDQQRNEDMQAIAAQMPAYLGSHWMYPSSISPEHGRGAMKLPFFDPTGAPYWYESNGQYFVLYAQRDGNGLACPEEPKHPVPGVDKLLCFIGP